MVDGNGVVSNCFNHGIQLISPMPQISNICPATMHKPNDIFIIIIGMQLSFLQQVVLISVDCTLLASQLPLEYFFSFRQQVLYSV